jgi:hypothetical protein
MQPPGWQLARDLKLLDVSSAEAVAARARMKSWPGGDLVVSQRSDDFSVSGGAGGALVRFHAG